MTLISRDIYLLCHPKGARAGAYLWRHRDERLSGGLGIAGGRRHILILGSLKRRAVAAARKRRGIQRRGAQVRAEGGGASRLHTPPSIREFLRAEVVRAICWGSLQHHLFIKYDKNLMYSRLPSSGAHRLLTGIFIIM